MKRVLAALFSTVLLGWQVSAVASDAAVLKLTLDLPPGVRKATPLRYALQELSAHVQGGYVLFGAEIREVGGREPVLDLNVAEGETLSEALRDVFRQVPGYTLEVVSEHMINVYPRGAKEDDKCPLNLRVDHFDVVNQWPDMLFNYPETYIPNLAKRLVERTVGPPYPVEYPSIMTTGVLGPRLTLHLRDVTLREILNAISLATEENFPANMSPVCWASLFHPDAVWAVGGTYSWNHLPCAPADWKKYTKPRPATAKTPAGGERSSAFRHISKP